jgi:hypothetical protein
MSDKETCNGCHSLEERITKLEQILLGYPSRPVEAPDGSPVARTPGDMVTPRQLARVRQLERIAHVDAEEECRAMFGCAVDALNRCAADKLITTLAIKAGATNTEGHATSNGIRS